MDWPRRTFGATAVVLLSCVALSISGCAQADPPGPPATTESTPTTAGAPVLTDEEALKIAVDAYQAYFAATSEVLNSGVDPNALLTTTSVEGLESERQNTLANGTNHQYEIHGEIVIRNAVLKHVVDSPSSISIEAYGCMDATGVKTTKDGIELQPTASSSGLSSIVFTVNNSEGNFKAAGIKPWELDDFCQ